MWICYSSFEIRESCVSYSCFCWDAFPHAFWNWRIKCSKVKPKIKFKKKKNIKVNLIWWFLMLCRYMGTITGIGDLDPVRWQNSHWRSVKVIKLVYFSQYYLLTIFFLHFLINIIFFYRLDGMNQLQVRGSHVSHYGKLNH